VSTSPDRRDVAFGVAVSALRVASTAERLAAVPARVAARAPLVGGPLRRAAATFEAEGRRARSRLEAAVTDLLGAPEVARAMDRVLAGPLAEQIARSFARHRVIERMAAEIAATANVDKAVADALDSRLVIELTDRILLSREMQRAVEHLASAPELRRALAEQSSGLADDMVDGLRQRSESMDEAAERTVRRWLRRR
jgi:hypothetical protein